MTIVCLPPSGSLKALRRVRADARLSREDQIDAFGRGQRDGEVHAFVTGRETVARIVKVGFEHTLSENPAISIGTRRVAGLDLVVRRLVGRVHCGDRRIVAFVSLEDRTTALRGPQSPLHVVTIRALLNQCPARSDRFKIEAISDLCGRTNLN